MHSRPSLDQHQNTITNYMYLGLLPFFAGTLGPWVFPDWESWFIDIFFFYSALILVFLSGCLWAVALFSELLQGSRHIHMAIILSLWPLVAYFLPDIAALSLMMVGFLWLLFWEKCFVNKLYPSWYQKLRHSISFIVVACHMLSIWNLIKVN